MMNDRNMKVPKMPFLDRKDRKDDEDLVLFRDLNKREKDRIASLLQPVSDEFEPNPGNYALYRIGSRKKGSGLELFAENEKNDYDWLKTPPATPLFPSIEMEATGAPELIIQREIPLLQPRSRFAGNPAAAAAIKGSTVDQRPKSPKPKSKPKVPMRFTTPSQIRPITISTISPTQTKTSTKPTTTTTILNPKTNSSSSSSTNPNNNIKKPNVVLGNTRRSITNDKEGNHIDYNKFITSNLSKNMGSLSDHHTKTKPRSRGVSPSTRPSTIPAQIPGFSNEPPPNLRTETRSVSATLQRPRRQSCSPSVTRGRKVDDELKKQESDHHHQGQKGCRYGTQILGSKMVDKVMNARKSSSGAEDREILKAKSQATAFMGRNNDMVSKSSSLDMALKQNKEIKREGTNFRHLGTVSGRSSRRQ